jgi:hypothetical protein
MAAKVARLLGRRIRWDDGRMMKVHAGIPRRANAACAALLLCSASGWFVTAACAQSAQPAPPPSPGITDRMKSFFFGSPSAPDSGTAAGTPAEIECPGVAVRQGASTLSISAPGAEATPMNTRYQVTIAQTARECAALGGVMTMKVGVQGRVLLGPAGGPGRVDVPLRVAVVHDGANPKPIISKLYRLAVDVPPGQTQVPFVHVEQDLTFPMPRLDVLDDYVVYVGFDPSAAPEKPERKQKRK